ncbi:MAG: LysM peptidoglycan-binding domain-containing protein [Deltaproteobacteria bacterium]|nr:LysM peptidoglycan-binding domain-containing protein [Deltaproteobacteria bacterium]
MKTPVRYHLYFCMTLRWVGLWAVSGAMLLSLGCSHFFAGPPSSTAPSKAATPAATDTGGTASPAGDSAAKTGAVPADRKEARLTPPDVLAGKSPTHMTKPSASAAALIDGTDEECILEEEDEEFQAGKLKGKQPALNRALYLCRLSQSYWQRGDLDKAIDTLDQAYALILDVDPGNDLQLLQEKEDLRHTISKRILEIYSSRHVVVNGKRNSIPRIINKHVQDEIDSFTTGRERDFFLEAYRRSGKYRSRMEAAMTEAGLPAELSWLPLIESGYKATALSPARALGLWQFIPSTGYRYNLNRDKYIDERLDPEKATRGAIEYLKELHEMFGDWATVLAGYNCGENRVLRTIQGQNINYLDNFWDLYEQLPRETARYVPRFLATLHIVSAPGKYGLDGVAVEPPLLFETVNVQKQAQLKSIAQATGIDDDILRELNAELRQGILPEDGYELRVPPGMADRVLANIEDIPVYRPGKVVVVQHKVRKGDTLDTLAKKYRSDVKNIMLANNMRRPQPLTVGHMLRVPLIECPPDKRPAPAQTPTQSAKAPAHEQQTIEHVVRPGDSLWNIAKRYGTTTQEIERLNRVAASNLTLGQMLKIVPAPPAPQAKLEPPKPRPGTTYAVRKGDTLHSIARSHNTTVERLLDLNKMQPQSKLQPGQKIRLD